MNQLKLAVSGVQILFVAFGAMVLVPLLTGLNPFFGNPLGRVSVRCSSNSHQRKVPIFRLFSFAFIAPIIYSIKQGSARPCSAVCGGFYVFCACRAD